MIPMLYYVDRDQPRIGGRRMSGATGTAGRRAAGERGHRWPRDAEGQAPRFRGQPVAPADASSRASPGSTSLWSLVPIALAVLFSFNDGKSQSVWQGFSMRWYTGDPLNSVLHNPTLHAAVLADPAAVAC